MLKFAALLIVFLEASAQAQVSPPSSPRISAELPERGEIRQAFVVAVEIRTTSPIGSYTAFLIRAENTRGPASWFYIRNDDVTKSLERGAMIGLLMGAAQANTWIEDGYLRSITISYETVAGRKMITAASLGGVPS